MPVAGKELLELEVLLDDRGDTVEEYGPVLDGLFVRCLLPIEVLLDCLPETLQLLLLVSGSGALLLGNRVRRLLILDDCLDVGRGRRGGPARLLEDRGGCGRGVGDEAVCLAAKVDVGRGVLGVCADGLVLELRRGKAVHESQDVFEGVRVSAAGRLQLHA